jgi:hypothetical protein
MSAFSAHEAATCSGVAVLPARRYAVSKEIAEERAGFGVVEVVYVGIAGGAVTSGGAVIVGGDDGAGMVVLKIGMRAEVVHVGASN